MQQILVIDDDEQVRLLLANALEHFGFVVLVAASANEGLKLYRRHRPDLVITDIVMPEKDGLRLIVELRNGFPNARILAISGGTSDGVWNQFDFLGHAEHFGALRTLPKPFYPDQLLAVIQELLPPEKMPLNEVEPCELP